MKKLSVILLCIVLQGISFHSVFAQENNRKLTITLDDLPTISLLNSPGEKQVITEKLLKTFISHQIPAIGFVNEVQLYKNGKTDSLQVGLLQQWLAAGMELGNHTYSHPSLHKTDTTAYFNEIIEGQMVTNKLLSAYNSKSKYFRHPYLHTGNTLEKKLAVEAFLDKNDLIVAPVTVDNSDWIFARAYDNAVIAGDSALMERIGKTYIEYMERCFAYFEQQSMQLLGYEMNQILLLHANAINADYLDEMATMLSERGYSFVSLGNALEDKAFGMKETYTGESGISWIHRWAITQGKEGDFFAGEPETPDYIVQIANIK